MTRFKPEELLKGIPADVFCKIIPYLRDQGLNNLARVDKEILSWINSPKGQRKIVIKNAQNFRDFIALLNSQSVSARFSELLNNATDFIFKSGAFLGNDFDSFITENYVLRNIARLTIERSPTPISNQNITNIFSYFTKLNGIYFPWSEIENISHFVAQDLEKLKEADFRYSDITDEGATNFLNKAENLEVLNLHGCDEISNFAGLTVYLYQLKEAYFQA